MAIIVRSSERHQAFLLQWFRSKSFGFLQGPNSHSERYFVHLSAFDEPLDFVPQVNQVFEFGVAPASKKGHMPRAVKVKMVRP